MIELTGDKKAIHKLLNSPEVVEILRDVLGKMSHSSITLHKLITRKELAHVDDHILHDLRGQGYRLFERASALNILLHLIEHKKANNAVFELFAYTFIESEKEETSLRNLLKTTLTTYAPALLKEVLG